MLVRVFVAGATGVLGYRLVDELADRGHDVVGLAHDGRGEALVDEHGGPRGTGGGRRAATGGWLWLTARADGE